MLDNGLNNELDNSVNTMRSEKDVMEFKKGEGTKNIKLDSHSPGLDTSFPSFFSRYNNGLKRFISRFLLDPQDIEDICQESFLRTYKSLKDAELEKPKSFLFRVAKNLIISDFRRASTRLTEYVEDIDLVESLIDPNDLENNAVAQEKLTIMFESIASLPAKCRQAVLMRKVYGLSTKVIAKRMGISVITVSNYISRGMCTYNEAVTRYNEGQSQHNTANVHKGKRRIT